MILLSKCGFCLRHCRSPFRLHLCSQLFVVWLRHDLFFQLLASTWFIFENRIHSKCGCMCVCMSVFCSSVHFDRWLFLVRSIYSMKFSSMRLRILFYTFNSACRHSLINCTVKIATKENEKRKTKTEITNSRIAAKNRNSSSSAMKLSCNWIQKKRILKWNLLCAHYFFLSLFSPFMRNFTLPICQHEKNESKTHCWKCNRNDRIFILSRLHFSLSER